MTSDDSFCWLNHSLSEVVQQLTLLRALVRIVHLIFQLLLFFLPFFTTNSSSPTPYLFPRHRSKFTIHHLTFFLHPEKKKKAAAVGSWSLTPVFFLITNHRIFWGPHSYQRLGWRPTDAYSRQQRVLKVYKRQQHSRCQQSNTICLNDKTILLLTVFVIWKTSS